jgi:hypothetical protein
MEMLYNGFDDSKFRIIAGARRLLYRPSGRLGGLFVSGLVKSGSFSVLIRALYAAPDARRARTPHARHAAERTTIHPPLRGRINADTVLVTTKLDRPPDLSPGSSG